MIKNIAVSAIVVTLIQHINFVCGHNSSEVTLTAISINASVGAVSTPQYKPTSSTLQSTTLIPSATRRKTVTLSVTSTTPTNLYTAANSSPNLSRSSATSAFTFSTSVLTSQSSKKSASPTSRSIHSPTAMLSSSTLHLSGTLVKHSTSPNLSFSSTGILFSFKSSVLTIPVSLLAVKNSSSTFVKSSSVSGSPFYSFSITTSHLSSSSLSATMNFTSLPASSSPIMASTTKTSGISTSSDYLSSSTEKTYTTFSHSHTESLSQTFSSNPLPLKTSSSDTSSLKSAYITTVGPPPSGSHILPSMKSSEMIMTKMVSSTTKKTASWSSAQVLEGIFLEFDGKLVVTPLSNEFNNNLKKLAASIEIILDKALKAVNGYFYSKVLLITAREHESKFDCTFKLFMRQPSSETTSTLLERIKKYNKTNGFGQFTLHSVETSVPCNRKLSTEERLYLWAIIVIAALGVLCLVLLVAFVCTRRKLKRSTKKSSPIEDNNSKLKYNDLFPSVFDESNDVSQNIPLKITSVSSTESKQPLKLSDVVETDSNPDEEDGKKSEEASAGESEIKEDKLSVQEPPQSTNVILHVQDDNDEDETKFSTFSRKR